MANQILFYYDVVSPWSYVAFVTLLRYRQLWKLDLQLRPVNLAYIMNASGNRPPISVPNKGTWMWEDMSRASKFYNVRLEPPPDFPVNTSLVQTFLRQLQDEKDANVVTSDHGEPSSLLEKATDIAFRAIWQQTAPVKTVDDLLALYKPKGLIAEPTLLRLLEKASQKETRSNLARESERLVTESGAFGAPWFVLTRESDTETSHWFGSDRFEQMAAWLDKPYRGPLADGRQSRL